MVVDKTHRGGGDRRENTREGRERREEKREEKRERENKARREEREAKEKSTEACHEKKTLENKHTKKRTNRKPDDLEGGALRADEALSALDELLLVADKTADLDDVARHLVIHDAARLRRKSMGRGARRRWKKEKEEKKGTPSRPGGRGHCGTTVG